MATEKQNKLNHLMQNWPPGTVAVQEWLSDMSISPNLTNWYLKSGWLLPIARGAYARPGGKVTWAGGLYAIQQYLKHPTHIGAKSALELLGHGHFVNMSAQSLFLFSKPGVSLPTWFLKSSYWDITVKYVTTSLFNDSRFGVIEKSVDGVNVYISGLERAILETLYLVPRHQSFSEARLLLQGLHNIRPKVMQALLENCHSVKVNRLFMHLAEEAQLAFVKHINTDNVNFGKGKRVIAGGGEYHSKYQLSLPKLREDE